MTFWTAGAILVGGYMSSKGATNAAGTQAASADRAAELQKEMFDKQMELNKPYREAGIIGQDRLMELMGLGGNTGAEGYGKYGRDFSMADYQADPGYAFRLSEGQKAIDRSAAARGGTQSGAALRAATRYGQDMGSQEYGNAYSRYQTNRTNQLQPAGSLMTSGQNAAANAGAAAGNYGASAGNLMMQGGQAIAAGQLGAGNTWNNALGTAASSYQNQQNFNNYLGQRQLNSANRSSDPIGSLYNSRGWGD